jgi:hypothetical protein
MEADDFFQVDTHCKHLHAQNYYKTGVCLISKSMKLLGKTDVLDADAIAPC